MTGHMILPSRAMRSAIDDCLPKYKSLCTRICCFKCISQPQKSRFVRAVPLLRFFRPCCLVLALLGPVFLPVLPLRSFQVRKIMTIHTKDSQPCFNYHLLQCEMEKHLKPGVVNITLATSRSSEVMARFPHTSFTWHLKHQALRPSPRPITSDIHPRQAKVQ